MAKYVDENQIAARVLWAATETPAIPGERGEDRLTRAALSHAGRKVMGAMSPEERRDRAKRASDLAKAYYRR